MLPVNGISTLLSDILDVSFLTGVFPSIHKIAKVVPIHKNISKRDYSNYHSVSLLSNLEKRKYSTTHNLISLTEDIRENIDERNIGCGFVVDLQKNLAMWLN